MSGVLPQPVQLTLPVAPWRAAAPPAAINAAAAKSARTTFPFPLMSRFPGYPTGSEALQERHGVGGEAFAAAGVPEPVGRRRADVHLAGPDRALEAFAHRLAVGRDPRLLADEHAVGVHELEAGRGHLGIRLPEEVERRDAAQALLLRRKHRPDVAEPGRAEERVDERVRDH